jgi:aminocarboxymuconate-semialdehyde decarboxylase
MGKFWLDSLVHDVRMLEYIMDLVGPKRICLGTDYPFPLGEDIPGELIHALNVSDDIKADMLHRSALEWLNLDMSAFRK